MWTRTLVALQIVGLFVLVCLPAAYADTIAVDILPDTERLVFTFDTIPGSGDVAGPAGSTVGWGYRITNKTSSHWLVVTALDAGTFLNGRPEALFDFPIVAPGATVTVPYDEKNKEGLYQLTWDATAPLGFVNSGDFVVTVDWYKGDPFDSSSAFVQSDIGTAAYTATVTGTTSVPLPSTLLLMAGGLAALVLNRANRKRFEHSKL